MTLDEFLVQWDAACEGGYLLFGRGFYNPFNMHVSVRQRCTSMSSGRYLTGQSFRPHRYYPHTGYYNVSHAQP